MLKPTTEKTFAERFDLNRTGVTGQITKIWSRRDGNVYAGLDLEPGKERGLQATLLLVNGEVNGEMVSLMTGDQVSVSGWVQDVPYEETLQDFLVRAKKPDLLREAKLEELKGITIQRAMTCVVPEDLLIDHSKEIEAANDVRLEGMVARIWAYSDHVFVRLAIYDSHTEILEAKKKPVRQAHYVTVQFTGSQVGGRPVKILSSKNGHVAGGLRKGARLRVAGKFLHRWYRESMKEFLERSKRLDVMQLIPDSDRIAAGTKANYLQSVIEADQMIQFTKK
ncbi:MAG: hypothetical protein JEZ06_21645 [Anaerolineaceae bacterium]|nr:hypothetical protein [Anaerolineaceae bacterium]